MNPSRIMSANSGDTFHSSIQSEKELDSLHGENMSRASFELPATWKLHGLNECSDMHDFAERIFTCLASEFLSCETRFSLQEKPSLTLVEATKRLYNDLLAPLNSLPNDRPDCMKRPNITALEVIDEVQEVSQRGSRDFAAIYCNSVCRPRKIWAVEAY